MEKVLMVDIIPMLPSIFSFIIVNGFGIYMIEKLDRRTDPNYISKPRGRKK